MSISSPPAPAPASGSAPLGSGGTPVSLRWGGLLRAELRRLRLRRFVVLAVLAYLALLLFALGAQFLEHTKDNGAARAQAQQAYDSELAQCRANPERFSGGPPGAGTAPPCEELFTVENFYFDRTYQVAQALPDAVTGAAATFAVVAFVLGASAVGAEWSARTLPALLVWEPRRVRVLLTKLLAVLLLVAALALLAQALTVGAGVLTGHLRGSFAPPPPPQVPPDVVYGPGYGPSPVHTGSFWSALALQSARAIGLALVAAGIGFAVAAAARSTAAALGAAFGYFAVVEIGLSGFRPQWQPWLLTNNAFGWMQRDGHRITLPRRDVNPEAGLAPEAAAYTVHLTNGETGLFLLVAVALALAFATWIFRRRDLT